MDAITFKFLIGLVVSKTLDICLMDVVTTYLYGTLDKQIYMKILEGFKMLEAFMINIEVFILLIYKYLYIC
jgi:mannitol-specific phosphotransferase system IIBC component